MFIKPSFEIIYHLDAYVVYAIFPLNTFENIPIYCSGTGHRDSEEKQIIAMSDCRKIKENLEILLNRFIEINNLERKKTIGSVKKQIRGK